MDVLSDEYLKWLSENVSDEKKLLCIPGFCNNSNVLLLEELFKRIDDYAKRNYYLNVTCFGYAYDITDGTNFYLLESVTDGEEIAYLIRRANNRANYIHINDVRKNVVVGKDNLEISNAMHGIIDNIRLLDEMGISMDTVERETSKQMRLLRYKKTT